MMAKLTKNLPNRTIRSWLSLCHLVNAINTLLSWLLAQVVPILKPEFMNGGAKINYSQVTILEPALLIELHSILENGNKSVLQVHIIGESGSSKKIVLSKCLNSKKWNKINFTQITAG